MKRCEYCNKPLVQKTRPNGTLETPQELERRKSCNLKCSNLAVSARRRKQNEFSPDTTKQLFRNSKRSAASSTDALLEEVYYGILKAEGEL